jgi:hypothetical protein
LQKKAPEDSDSDSDLCIAGSDEDSGSDEHVGKTKQPLKKRKVTATKSVKRASSDEESDDEEQGYDDGYGDDLMGDTEDRERADTMTVIEREMERSDRADAHKKIRRKKGIPAIVEGTKEEATTCTGHASKKWLLG